MDTRLDRQRVAKMMAATLAELVHVPDSQAKRAALDRIEDRYIEMMALVRRRSSLITGETLPHEAEALGCRLGDDIQSLFRVIEREVEAVAQRRT